jgi:hypothetical protein
MADYNLQTTEDSWEPQATFDPLGLQITAVKAVDRLYLQRVYSASAGWCYYAAVNIDTNPTSTSTTPNHANDIVAGTHSLLGEV